MGSDSAIFAWVGIAVANICYVVAYDLWAAHSNHRTMTNQFREWLTHPVMGPIIAALWVAIFVGLTFHFIIKAHS